MFVFTNLLGGKSRLREYIPVTRRQTACERLSVVTPSGISWWFMLENKSKMRNNLQNTSILEKYKVHDLRQGWSYLEVVCSNS